eukprot:5594778-Pleurochrysis_carterae.AAC.3
MHTFSHPPDAAHARAGLCLPNRTRAPCPCALTSCVHPNAPGHRLETIVLYFKTRAQGRSHEHNPPIAASGEPAKGTPAPHSSIRTRRLDPHREVLKIRLRQRQRLRDAPAATYT